MKVVVLGGYGVFGARLVRLLVRDGHQVTVAGRSLAKGTAFVAAQKLAEDVGVLQIDRSGDLGPLWDIQPDVVVDAAGPFHAYGDDPYRLAGACIAQGVHYLDLADDPAFCAGIGVLDTQAQTAGIFALSGMSSVPALSSAAVAALAEGALEIDTISSAILPGNRAPRGKAVIQSILHQCGKPFDIMLDGAPVPMRSWAHPDRFDLGQGMIRKGWMIEVPDHRLFAIAFGARTVLFRAGLELGVMNYGLAAFSWMRGKVHFPITDWFVQLVLWGAKRLWPFGTDEGGMSVAVTARYPGGWQRKTWRLIARAGEGPFIPAVPARVILRMADGIAAGARPAVAEVPLAAIIDGMADLAVEDEQISETLTPLFQRQLGAAFDQLPTPLRETHQVYGPRRFTGRARVTRGQSLWSRIIAGMFRFPKAAPDMAVTVIKTPSDQGEIWERNFAGQRFRSVLRQQSGQLTERFGPFTFVLGVHTKDDALHFPVISARIGPLPLPRLALPKSVASETVVDGAFCFDVKLLAPLTGALIVRYQGTLAAAHNGEAT